MQTRKADRTENSSAVKRGDLAERIRSARQRAGITQRELAEKLSVSTAAVGRWETNCIPPTDRMTALAHVLDVTVDWLSGKSRQVSHHAAETDGNMEEDLRLIEEARQLGVDLRSVVELARQQRWREENRGAIEDANAFIGKRGLWSDGKRLF